ncbi:RFX1 Transcriptional regulator RFX1 [Candida maltosa Xu316]
MHNRQLPQPPPNSTFYPQPAYPINYQQNIPNHQQNYQFDYTHGYTTQQQPAPAPPPLQNFQSTNSPAPTNSSSSSFPPLHHEQSSDSTVSSTIPQKRKRPRKQESSSSITGESELKSLALRSTDVPLPELAHRIKQLENDVSHNANSDQSKLKENKETQRSLFGMVWLLNSCQLSPTAVIPRNRIYARYVQVCADNGLAPVSPASFGKLVKILYPNITTRRLGMRGQSKYHYCGIKLNGDENMQSQLLNLQHQQQQQQQHSHHQHHHHHHHHQSSFQGPVHSPISSSNSSISYEESPAPISRAHTPSFSPINSPGINPSSILNDQLPSVSHMKFIPNLFQLLNSNVDAASNPYTPINLPSIYPYLTKDADNDIADTLYSLYKVHVNSIFEALRFMQLKKLFSSFNSFNSILTAPVFKLYTTDSITEWIMKCDLMMYKKMIRMLSKLQLQLLIPQEQLAQLKQISSGYIKTLSSSLVNSKVSRNFVLMKLKLAKHFVNLLNRLIKVIETGQPASRILTDDNEKTSMVQDWTKLDLNEVICREIPCAEKNLDTLNYILTSEVLNLIKVKNDDEASPTMNEFANYVSNLPSRFPNINPRLFLLLSSNLLTTCLREISLSGGEGFGAWWIVRCWVDEYLAWTFEVGGFFQADLQEVVSSSHQDPMLPSLQTEYQQNTQQQQQPQQQQTHQQNDDDTGDLVFGNIDLLETSFDFDSKNVPSYSQHTHAESLLNFETNIDNLLS